MMTAREMQGVYAIIPTPAKEGADHWDATDTVDLDETARLVDRLIADGVSGLIILGTTGECATLTRADYDNFVDCVLATVAKRVPTFVGTTALGTHEIVSRIRFVRDKGADGTLLGMPMWQPLTTEMAIRFYASISEAFPDFAIMVYANPRAFRFDFSTAFWKAVAVAAPTVMSAKYMNLKALQEDLAASGRRINFVPIDDAVYHFYRAAPETTTACWATAASMGPQPSIALMDAILAGNIVLAEQIAADIAKANEPVDGIVTNPEIFASYNIQFEKMRIDEAGYCRPGPIRPPYDVIPKDLELNCRENGRRWAQLCVKYTRRK